ncbi:hypothetical protein SmJEL517_g02832 [Synchytrium microbalum]|uniref:Acetoacetate--CoA ligase n=1 Tax=Synchytrium microbalum TaxID=1806994 RepID=A0A507C593_9FUNG|nr:uncharacterized protein SmJEL517_g02832 [Synchytrium microbalum]TPX34548.1 hypothetical protein SmJEL517_g02832 [Synchytrium microbalum]
MPKLPTPKCLWKPPSDNTSIHRFIRFVNDRHDLKLANYYELWKWSVTSIEDFWASVWEFTEIVSFLPPTEILQKGIPMNKIPLWFSGARLNFAQNLLRYKDDRDALIGTGENGDVSKLTYAELYNQVTMAASAMRKAGVVAGDVVAGYCSNCIENVVAFLAATSIGAIWTSASPDFGVLGVLERFDQVNPKLLVSVNAVCYNGKVWDHMEKLKQVAAGLSNLQKVVVIPFVSDTKFDMAGIPNCINWNDFLQKQDKVAELKFEQLPFNHPLVILYSSGTTGKPKCIVHSAGGILIQHLKEHIIHGGMTRNDVYFYYTTTGWMMWNWLVSGLATGATVVCFDGSPFKPTPEVLFSLVDRFGITKFGTSAKYIQTLQENKIIPNSKYSLKTLDSIYSTGSPLKPESFDYVYQCISPTAMLASITGGTDICSLFGAHNIALPVYRGEVQCRGLGMKVEAWDESGKPVVDETGDMMCIEPFPVMPVYFWDDKDGSKYTGAYFSKFEGVWYHGDFMFINSETGGITMLGRSDGTLNPGGVRFGSAELYNILENYPQVADSLVVGQKLGDDERVVMFLKMGTGQEFNQKLVSDIKERIRKLLSARHVPAFILPIADIPHTLTGKKVEVAVKRIISGESVAPSGALANPESLKLYYNIPELKV